MQAIHTLFGTNNQARETIDDLLGQGFARDDMYVIIQDYVVRSRIKQRRDTSTSPRCRPVSTGWQPASRTWTPPVPDAGRDLQAETEGVCTLTAPAPRGSLHRRDREQPAQWTESVHDYNFVIECPFIPR